MESPAEETFISVDVETAGPNPGGYSLLSIGACVVFEPQKRFYAELQPVNEAFTEEALRVSKLDMAQLKSNGLRPSDAMKKFADWVGKVTPADSRAVLVALNAPFDWMFVADYFHRFLGCNPFGHKALDMKAYFMGLRGIQWEEAGFEKIAKCYQINHRLNHNALDDAVRQAALFRKMLKEQTRRRNGKRNDERKGSIISSR